MFAVFYSLYFYSKLKLTFLIIKFFQHIYLYLPVDLAKSTSISANKRATIVENRVERIKDLNGQMQSSVRDLKNKILLARQKASSVSKNILTLFIYIYIYIAQFLYFYYLYFVFYLYFRL